MFGNPKGEVRRCIECGRFHDIKRGTALICACGDFVKSKEYTEEVFKQELNQFFKEGK